MLLLDLSESTNEKIGNIAKGEAGYEEQDSILDLTRESAGLLAWAIDSIGDNFAVHGFASDGRHDVQYFRFKDFAERYDDEAKSRLAGMKGGLSTRMGAALRHAGWHLTQQNAQKRLVLLVTDGEPADIDERDPQYVITSYSIHYTKLYDGDVEMQVDTRIAAAEGGQQARREVVDGTGDRDFEMSGAQPLHGRNHLLHLLEGLEDGAGELEDLTPRLGQLDLFAGLFEQG